MARTWRKGFTLFVIIFILTTFRSAITLSNDVSTTTRTFTSIYPKLSEAFSSNSLGFGPSSNRYRMDNWAKVLDVEGYNAFLKSKPALHSIEDIRGMNNRAIPNHTKAKRKPVRPPNSLQPHERINIQSDADFTNQGWPGNGTQENPYYITGFHVRSLGWLYCIKISDTRVHFVISNCLIEGEDYISAVTGVSLINVTNGLVTNTTCVNLDYGATLRLSASIELVNNTYTDLDTGIRVLFSSNTWLVNNTFSNADRGIAVFDSNSIMITYNTCNDIRYAGIEVSGSNFTILLNNTCTNSDRGIRVFNSFSTEVINNTCVDNDFFGCEIYPVNNNILVNNSLMGCGFFFGIWEDQWNPPSFAGVGSLVNAEDQITGNFVNQRPLIFWQWRMEGTVPQGAGQIILMNCSRIIVQDQYLTNASIGIILCFTTHTRIFNNTCNGHSMNGIRVQNSVNITVNNNFCTNNNLAGITLAQSTDTIVANNTCNHSPWRYGIHLVESENNQLLNNTCINNEFGIRLETSHNNQLLNNTCNHNRSFIWFPLWGFGAGISIFGESNMIAWNLCNDNWKGIEIIGQDNSVLENTCTNNRFGIYLESDTTPISNNLCVNDEIGIYINDYLEIAITDNTMIDCGLFINYHGSEWTADVEISGNTVNGRPLFFYRNRVNGQVPSGAGQIILFNCQGITVRGQTLTNCSDGLLVYCTNHSLFVDNVLGDNKGSGILVFDSHNNHFTRNIFTNRDAYGIILSSGSQANVIDWNIFLCNASHDARDHGPEFQNPRANIFDRNYWANYTGYDANWDGFGDIPYNVTGNADNIDLHPLMTPVAVLARRQVERLLFLLEGLAILAIVIVVFIVVRVKFRRPTPTSTSNLRSTVKPEKE